MGQAVRVVPLCAVGWPGTRPMTERPNEVMESSPHRDTILLLIADTGSGHRSAAQAIRGALHLCAHVSPLYAVTSVDVFAVCSTFPLRKLGALYRLAITSTPWLYDRLFRLTNRPVGFKVLERLLYLCLRRGLARLFAGAQPNVIVSLHPLLNHVSLRVLAEMQMKVPFLTVMTDLVTPHRGWAAPRVDGCAVPTPMAEALCRQYGMAAEKLRVLGMPIDLKFSREDASRELLRAKLGLDPALPTLLLAGGGEGAGKLAQMVCAIWQAELPVQLIVVAGRNARLRRQLERWRRQVPASLRQRWLILGFVQQMPELMRAADLMVTKAGPASICEAMACGLPLLLTSFVPGQEEGNVGYVCEQGIGRMVETPEHLVATLRACLQPDSPLLQEMRDNMARLANPLAALRIAEFVWSYLPQDG